MELTETVSLLRQSTTLDDLLKHLEEKSQLSVATSHRQTNVLSFQQERQKHRREVDVAEQ